MKKTPWLVGALALHAAACTATTETTTTEPEAEVTVSSGAEVSATAEVPPTQATFEIAVTDDHIEIPEKIHFATGSAEILEDSYPLLDAINQVIVDNPDIRAIQVIGHTDTTGSAQDNQLLSLERARSVVNYLVEHGATIALRGVGEGENQPLCTETTPECNQMNRRVEFLITQRD